MWDRRGRGLRYFRCHCRQAAAARLRYGGLKLDTKLYRHDRVHCVYMHVCNMPAWPLCEHSREVVPIVHNAFRDCGATRKAAQAKLVTCKRQFSPAVCTSNVYCISAQAPPKS